MLSKYCYIKILYQILKCLSALPTGIGILAMIKRNILVKLIEHYKKILIRFLMNNIAGIEKYTFNKKKVIRYPCDKNVSTLKNLSS